MYARGTAGLIYEHMVPTSAISARTYFDVALYRRETQVVASTGTAARENLVKYRSVQATGRDEDVCDSKSWSRRQHGRNEPSAFPSANCRECISRSVPVQ